jgi:hypothetical protein
MRGQYGVWGALVGVALTVGCGHKGGDEDPYTPDRVVNLQRNLKYHKVIVHPYAVDKSVEDPGTAPLLCHQSTIDFLAQKRIFASLQEAPDAVADADTLTVDATVQSLRIVGGAARFWGGAWAGSSHMTLMVVAKDSTGATVGERAVGNDNNSMGAAWSGGATDRGLPGEVGTLVADAIVKMAQGLPAQAAAK